MQSTRAVLPTHRFSQTNWKNEARIITGMLTASSFHGAKQNSIKLTNTTELIPTQSTQEIGFFHKPLQCLVLHRFLRHVSLTFKHKEVQKNEI